MLFCGVVWQVSRFPEKGDALKKNAQLPPLDEKVPVDEAAMLGQNDNTETYFMADNTDGDDTGVTLDSIRMESAPVRIPPRKLLMLLWWWWWVDDRG